MQKEGLGHSRALGRFHGKEQQATAGARGGGGLSKWKWCLVSEGGTLWGGSCPSCAPVGRTGLPCWPEDLRTVGHLQTKKVVIVLLGWLKDSENDLTIYSENQEQRT